MYNGIGLTTPRGSGTNGYVVRNLSHLRSRDGQQDMHKFDQAPPKHREPDAGILEHERLRKIEVRCLELQLELEENNIPEENIEAEVSKLREQLMASMTSVPTSGKNLKPNDTHGMALAKKTELDKMARALGTSSSYVEGDAFNREKQEELRRQRAVEREENDRRREELRQKRDEENKRRDAERREQDRLRRRREDQARRERESRMPPPPPPGRGRDDDARRSPPRDYSPRRRDRSPPRRRSPSPYSRRARYSRRSRSPRRDSRSPRRRDSRSPSPVRRASRSPSPKRDRDSRSASPPRRRRSPSPDSPRGRPESRSPSPKRARSKSADSAMSVSGDEQRGLSRPPTRSTMMRSIVTRNARSLFRTQARFASTKPCTTYTSITHPEDEASIPESVKAHLAELDKSIVNTYARPPFILQRGKGSWVWDTTGRKYLDFSAGIAVNALGHGDAELAKVAGEQAAILLHTSNAFHHEWAGNLASLIVGLTKRDGGLGFEAGSEGVAGGAKVFFSNSGTEANEGALKFARKVGKERWAQQTGKKWEESTKTRIACFANAFHGRSMGALSATTNPKYQAPFAPLVPGFDVGQYNDVAGIDSLVGQDTCAVLVEPVQGEGGVHGASQEFLRALRKRCDEVGAVLIFDEIQASKLWAHAAFPIDCHPDVVTMAKPLANGFPVGAILVRDNIAQAMTVGSHGTTFGGSPIATRLGHHVLSRLSQPEFITHVKTVAQQLDARLAALPGMFPSIIAGPARGRGLLRGVPFKNPDDPAKLVKLARERGVLLLTAGKDAVRLVPSLNIGSEEVDHAVDVIESCLHVLQQN
ncbi:Aminotransferase [Rhizoctonia solani]|uniref:Aminotransferase n=1 Tax=Rhizoctonia solani TaxID=456999 RepID=A0A8H7LL14_9AGAM|nr:Aminotransferase [Rhizoctonia solani]